MSRNSITNSESFYQYPLEQCDVPDVRRKALGEYRAFREKCLRYLRGPSGNPVYRQIGDLAWYTAVFHTLNEVRRIEPDRKFSKEFWKLTVDGYASLMTLGIRRLVDRRDKQISIWNVVKMVEKRPELLTREKFVCHDGLPYAYQASLSRYRKAHGGSIPLDFHPVTGPDAWGTSEIMHKAFDRLSGYPDSPKPSDTIHPSVILALKEKLTHPAVEKIRTLANRHVAHAEYITDDSELAPIPTYEEVTAALQVLCTIANFLASTFFWDGVMGTVVPIGQRISFEALDEPWVTSDNLHLVKDHWNTLCESMNNWSTDNYEQFLPLKQGSQIESEGST